MYNSAPGPWSGPGRAQGRAGVGLPDAVPPTPPAAAAEHAHDTLQERQPPVQSYQYPYATVPDPSQGAYGGAETAPPTKGFGKWGRWIQEAASRRKEEIAELRAAGLAKPTSWSLPGQEREASPLRRDPSALRRDEAAERSLSRDHLVLVTDPDSSSPTSPQQDRSTASLPRGRSRTNSSASGSAAAVQHLTRHMRIERVGERFSEGLPEKPLCGCPLPIGPHAATGRFTLIGTRHGLYVLDMQPNAGIAAGESVARHHALWTGLGVHQIETYAETDPWAETPRGLVLALVEATPGGDLELRMWNIASIVNLVKWRVYSATSLVLTLGPDSGPAPTHARTKSTFGVRAATSPEKKRTGPTKRWSSASTRGDAPRTQPDSSRHSASSCFPSHPNPRCAHGVDSDLEDVESPSTPRSSTSHLATGGTAGRPRSASETSHLELPTSWVSASVALPVPKYAGPIRFFRLFRRPPREPPVRRDHSSWESSEEEDSDEEWDARPQLGTTRVRSSGRRHHLFMFVATNRSIFLYESEPVERRTWHLAKEYFSPSTPRFMQLVRSARRDTPSFTGNASSLPSNLSLLLGTSHHLALIRLADATVADLKIIGLQARPGSVHGKPSAGGSGGDKPRAVQRTKSQQHRKASPSFAASLRDLNASVSRLFDGGDRNLPAGVRGVDSDFVKSHIVSDDGHGHEEHSDAAESSAGSSHHSKWLDCAEIRLAATGRPASGAELLLLSNTRTSYLVALPRSDTAPPATGTPPVMPVLLHAFHWAPAAGPLVAVSATISAHPSTPSSEVSHLSLSGFTATGVLVSEHLISHAAVAASAPFEAPPVSAVIQPLATHHHPAALSLRPALDADPDLSDRAAFDLGRAIGRICSATATTTTGAAGAGASPATAAAAAAAGGGGGGGTGTGTTHDEAQSVLFWVQGRAEWTLKRLVCGAPA